MRKLKVEFKPTTGVHPIHNYMRRPKEQTHITESYVSSPPALIVVDERGDVWTLGNDMRANDVQGEYSFNVLRNGVDAGEVASRIERRDGKVRVFTATGWKRWNGRFFF